MRPNWQALEQELVGGIYGKAQLGTYTPTLVIGLGGSGIKTLRYLKNALLRHELSCVHLLGIDSDDNENLKWPDLPQLSQKELIILDQGVATAMLARAAAEQDGAKHVLQYLPDAEPPFTNLHTEVRKKIAAQKGAGQFRRAGRLLFHANVNGGANISGQLSTIRQEMQGMPTVIQQQEQGLTVASGAAIYLVTSLAGGTGAGILLDCVALLRDKFTSAQDVITAFCFLPGELLDKELYNPPREKPVTRGNTVALLRELQAAEQGYMNQYTFHMDGITRVGPFSHFLDDIYLIGDRSDKGTPANSYMELTQALAHFLYSFVGAGVGATATAGAINGQINPTMRAADVPLVFNSLGVGVLEYPIQELAGFGVRCSLGEWVKRWSKAKMGASEVKAAVEEFLGGEPLLLKSFETLRARLVPPETELRRAKFLQDPGLRKAFLNQPDEVFVTKGLSRVEEIDTILQGMEETFRANADKWQNDAVARAEGWVLENLGLGLQDGQRHVETLQARLEAFVSKLAAERERRDATIQRLKSELTKDAARIHFWDFWLDSGLRKRFLEKIDRYLALKVDEAADAHAVFCLSEFKNAVGGLRARVEALQNSASLWATENDREVQRICNQSDVPGFVQHVIPYREFPKWTQQHVVKVPDFSLPGLDWVQVLRAAFESIKTDYQEVLRGLNVVQDAKQDATLKQRLITLNTASVPMIHRIETAPEMTAMAPQKFVAGTWQEDDPFVAANFPPPSGRDKSTLVQTTNSHVVACAQTCHGFGAAHWRLFADAEAYYRENPWYFHVLEKFQSLPPLQQPSVQESENLRLFGLGLMFELILARGSNYYRNMLCSARDDVCYFLVCSAGRSAEATELAKTGLIKEPPSLQNKPKAQDRLGDSLESAIQALSNTRSADFRRQLTELVDDFKGSQGASATATLVSAYTSNSLAKQIRKAGPTRDLLEKIAAALGAYANSLV